MPSTTRPKRVSPADLNAEQRAEYERLKKLAIANRHLEGPPLPQIDVTGASPFAGVLLTYLQSLKAAREAAGLTLAQVAMKTGLAEETLCRLESGAVANPTWRTLGLYATALNMELTLTATPLPNGRKGKRR